MNKRLIPTKDLEIIKNKRFEAIDVEEKYYKPIPAIKFNSVNRWSINKVEEVVYQTEDQLNSRSVNFANGPTLSVNNANMTNLSMISANRNAPSRVVNYGGSGNIYTSRTNNLQPQTSFRAQPVNLQSMQPHYQPQKQEYSPR